MKIAFTFLTYGRDVFGGIENALFNITKGLKDIGHEPIVFTSSTYASNSTNTGKLPAETYISKHLPNHYNGNVTSLIKCLKKNSAEINSDFDIFLEKYKPDFIIVIDPIWGILQVTKYPIEHLTTRIPVAMSYHIANTWKETQDIMAVSFKTKYSQRYSVSKFLSSEIRKNYPQAYKTKIHVLPNSLNTDLYKKQPKYSKEKYIFCNSRIAPGKNIDTLVKAFSKIPNHPELKLKVCTGNFPFAKTSFLIADIRKLVKKMHMESKVQLLPKMKWSDVTKIVKGATAVVLPSTYETFGIAALEACVAGIPLIATNTNNFKTLAKNIAVFVKPNDTQDLQKKITLVLNKHTWYKNRAERRAKEFKKQYDNKIIAKKLIYALLHNNVL
ncbi:MAG: group 1 glycosyl transferase [uncultured bacterium]|nr:MAG: group 1 glycosyl transferase [uncultured bacterium]